MAKVVLRTLSKVYPGDIVAVNDINLEIQRGELVEP